MKHKYNPSLIFDQTEFTLFMILHLGFERDEDNVPFYWDNKGSGSIVPIPLTLYYHGGGVLSLSRRNENFSTETIFHVLVWKWNWDEGLDSCGIWRASIGTMALSQT